MKSLSILVAIYVIFSGLQASAEGMPIRIRSDGYVINANGAIIAVPDTKNSLNNKTNTYYKSLGPDGKPVAQSDFYVTADPDYGYLRHPISDARPANDPGVTTAQTPPPAEEPKQQQGNYGSMQILEKSPDAPIYDNYSTPRSVY